MTLTLKTDGLTKNLSLKLRQKINLKNKFNCHFEKRSEKAIFKHKSQISFANIVIIKLVLIRVKINEFGV
ncbi:hypothetical protein GCM10023210_29540 [Chryseobacterium ginsengisoli]|uniref:Uncharacterized protein n=1 Tax=Chryseobacterium ginsengisoli TaxID=363853 RepID=A0ABP9MJL9_9FLAO